MQHLGFQALATTSAGFAFSRGCPDSAEAVGRDAVLAHIAEIVQASGLPVNADFGSGYADSPEGVATNVSACVATGVSGLSIEDATGKTDAPLYELQEAIERMQAAREAAGESVLLTGRAECYLTGHPQPLQESLQRLRAYSEAGADVLYAPGVTDPEAIRELVAAVSPKPFNLLMSSNIGLRVDDVAAFGVRRISVGSSLARAAWTGFLKAARAIAENGSFAGFDGMVPYGELNEIFETRTYLRASKHLKHFRR